MATRNPSTRRPGAADLLAEAAWLRSLALRLVRDEADADDLVQETWRRALERPPNDRRALPAWLARVARNTAAEKHRLGIRRRAREIRAAKPEAVPAVAEVVARTELHRRLVDALLALDEPFRSTLLLRYFDDLTPKRIAERLGVPAATVRSRLKRGLDQLRRRLDSAHGGERRAWVLLLVPLARNGGASAVGTTTALLGGTVAISTGKQIGIVVGMALCLLVGGLFVAPRLLPDNPPSGHSAHSPLAVGDANDEPRLVGRQAAHPE